MKAKFYVEWRGPKGAWMPSGKGPHETLEKALRWHKRHQPPAGPRRIVERTEIVHKV